MSMLNHRRSFKDDVRRTVTGPIEFVCLDSVVYELQRLVRAGRGKSSRLAQLALGSILKTARVEEAPFGPREVDLSIVIFGLAEKGRVVIATVDRKMLELCSKNRVPWIRPRTGAALLASWTDS